MDRSIAEIELRGTVASGEADIAGDFAPQLVVQLDRGAPIGYTKWREYDPEDTIRTDWRSFKELRKELKG